MNTPCVRKRSQQLCVVHKCTNRFELGCLQCERNGRPMLFNRRQCALRALGTLYRELAIHRTDKTESRPKMMYARMFAICTLGIVCSTQALEGQSLSQYRNFELSSDLASVSALAGIQPSTARVIHQRPAVLQELEWRPSRWVSGSIAASTDPVEQLLFSFYNDQLFRIVVGYGRSQTEGMTPADMIAAISGVYGTPLPRTSRPARPASRIEKESGSPLARWGNSEHTVALYQTSSYGAEYRLIVSDVRLDDLARKAESQAALLDNQEAPAKEIARQKKERDDARAAAVKARAANKDLFRP